MKKKDVIVMLALVAICALLWFFFLKDRTGPEAVRLPAFWPSVNKTDVQSITIKGQGNELRVKRREGASDRWDEIVGTELLRADANKIDDLLAAVAGQSVSESIPHEGLSAQKVAAYGLDKPLVEVEVGVPGRPAVLCRYGKLSSEGGKIYVDGGPGTDVWVVKKDAMDLAISAVAGDVRGRRLFNDGLFDVSTVEVVKDGVTFAQVTRDQQQIWRFEQPFKGYANNDKFENQVCAPVVNVQVEKWEEIGATDLVKYGLQKPQYEVRVTRKGEGKKPEIVFASANGASGCFVMEAGTRTVASVGKPFLDALTLAPMTYRDRSFTRLGIDGTSVDVEIGTVHYKLEKAGANWDVVMGVARRPADGDKVGKLLDKIRSWQTQEFLDAQKPEDVGISDKDFIEIGLTASGRDAPGKLVLLIGDLARRPDAKTVYGQRRGDGGVERVDSDPLDEMLNGPQQYFRNSVVEWTPEWVMGVKRAQGFGDEGKKLYTFGIERAGVDKEWRSTGAGLDGQLDGQAISDMLAALRVVKAVEWKAMDPEKDNEVMGFRPPLGETMTIEVHVGGTINVDPTAQEIDPKIYIGKRRPEGGYFARKADDKHWAFILREDLVEALKKSITKPIEKPLDNK